MVRIINATLTLIAMVMLVSCNYERPDAEGVIYYDISFPFLDGSMLQNVFPEEMTLWFKDDLVKGEIRSLGGIMKTSFIADNRRMKIDQMLKNYSDYSMTSFDAAGVSTLLADQPGVRLEPTGDSVSVAGYRCAVTIAHFLIDSVPPIALYHTNQIDIRHPNWYTQFNELDEVLLGYEIEQFGMRMKLKARQVIKKELPDDLFLPEGKYTPISPEDFKHSVRSLLSDFFED
jgi:hypothetical protein